MTRPRVLLDCDGVLADFVGGVLPIVRQVTGRDYTHEDVAQYSFSDALGLTRNESEIVLDRISSSPDFCASLKPFDHAQNGVAALHAIADVYIVTSPWNTNPTWTFQREAWLKRHFDIPSKRVVHTSAKHLCVGDMHVDDKTSTLVEWRASHPSGAAVQWSTPHNRKDEWTGKSTREWGDLARIIELRGTVWP